MHQFDQPAAGAAAGNRGLGQDLDEVGNVGDPVAGEEGDFLTHVQPRIGVAHLVHKVDDALEFLGFKGEHPFVVAQREGLDGVGPNVGEGAGGTAVFGEDAAAFGRVHDVPVVGPDEGVDGNPVAGFFTHDEAGKVTLIEFAGPVKAVAKPEHFGGLAEDKVAAETVVGVFDVGKFFGMPPEHEVGFGAATGNIVDAADGNVAFGFECGEEFLGLGNGLSPVGAERAGDGFEGGPLAVALNVVEFFVVDFVDQVGVGSFP